MPSNLPGGLSRFWAIWGEKWPEKKVSRCVWGYFRGVFMMFSDGFDTFWALQTVIWVIYHPEASRGLVACKGGGLGT